MDWALARGRGRGERRDDAARRATTRRDDAGRRGGCGANATRDARAGEIWLRVANESRCASPDERAIPRDFIPHTRSFVVRVLTFAPSTFRAARLEGLGCSATLPRLDPPGRFPALAPARRRAPSMRARASSPARVLSDPSRAARRDARRPRALPPRRVPRAASVITRTAATNMSSSKRARADAPAAASAEGYPDVMAPRPRGEGLPGLTRSVYERDHALITPESRVWCG